MSIEKVYHFQKPTLVDLRRVGEYATLFRWNLYFPREGLPTVFGGNGEVSTGIPGYSSSTWRPDILNSINSAGGDAFFKKLNVLCESSTTPSKSVNKMNVTLRGHTFFQPGIVSLAGDGITLNFVENTENVAHQLFYAWQEAIWAMNLGVGVPYDNLVADRIELTRLDNADRPICTYHLRFAFLKSYTPGDGLNGNSSDPLMSSVTLSFDDFYVTGVNLDANVLYNKVPGQLYQSSLNQ